MRKILITGGSGLIGSAIKELLYSKDNYKVDSPNSQELDLLDGRATVEYFKGSNYDLVVHCAARVGGISANFNFPRNFSVENMTMQVNLVNGLLASSISRVINLSSACIYPLSATLPLRPEQLMSGILEPTNRWYAMAKLSMLSMLEALSIQDGIRSVSILPANVYGPRDNFHESDGHVVPSLLARAHKSKLNGENKFKVWGTGKPQRELIYVEDLARAIDLVIEKFDSCNRVLNVGSGEELSIREIAEAVLKTLNHEAKLEFDGSKPDGVYRKPISSSEIRELGWKPCTSFEEGLQKTYTWFLENMANVKKKGLKN